MEHALRIDDARPYSFAYRAKRARIKRRCLLKWLKRWFNELYDFPRPCRWQSGGFDRLLRTSESIHEKWNYIRENPVRAGLVQHWKQWPYRKGFFDDEI